MLYTNLSRFRNGGRFLRTPKPSVFQNHFNFWILHSLYFSQNMLMWSEPLWVPVICILFLEFAHFAIRVVFLPQSNTTHLPSISRTPDFLNQFLFSLEVDISLSMHCNVYKLHASVELRDVASSFLRRSYQIVKLWKVFRSQNEGETLPEGV